EGREPGIPLTLDRARWGVSGALQPDTRSSGAELPPEGSALRASTPRVALMARSRAMGSREPGQVRKEAALSGLLRAPRASLAGATTRRARLGARCRRWVHG